MQPGRSQKKLTLGQVSPSTLNSRFLQLRLTRHRFLSGSQIYEALEGRWPWFSYAGKGWKNTVRNVLSLGPSFQKATDGEPAHRAQGGGERGVYWSVQPGSRDLRSTSLIV